MSLSVHGSPLGQIAQRRAREVGGHDGLALM